MSSPSSGSGSFATARTNVSFETAREPGDEWRPTDVLHTASLPCTSTIRKKWFDKCPCESNHRSFQDFCKKVIDPCMRNGSEVPQVEVCWNANNLWETRLPTKLTGLDKRVSFDNLPSVWYGQKVLYEGTRWFRRLIRKENSVHNRNGVALLRMLAGKQTFSGPERVDQLVTQKISLQGLNKVKNILATVDGLIMQLVLSFPTWDALLDWSRIDQVIHCLICQLIPDYFRKDIPETPSSFEKIKRLRGAIKEMGFNPIGDLRSIEIPREISFMKVITNFLSDRKTPIDMYRISVMSQTRASGVPPRSVYLKTLQEVKEVLTEPPDPSVYERVKVYIADGIDMIHQEIVESIGSERESERFWSSVINKAKVSLSDSGEFFTNSESGGKLEAARKILRENPKIQELNLHTGLPTGKILIPGSDQPGECLFHWACGQFSERRTVYDRNVMSVRISLVAELGKYRAITVSHLAHAMMLHVLSHVLLEYIRVIPSSRSGVGAANHAWNFFKRLSHKNPSANFIFGDKDTYLFSTDWKNATDYCDHMVAQAMINRLCYNIGVPAWYRQTAVFALCAPRQIEEMDEDKLLSRYFTTRGELMGDPVVKVILHCYHLVARYAASKQLRGMPRARA
nr:MAG: RNA-dependent RNA polymerase [Leptosphaeria biglobosa narnavirus 5]